jgi:hypothetical protein
MKLQCLATRFYIHIARWSLDEVFVVIHNTGSLVLTMSLHRSAPLNRHRPPVN